MPEGPSIRITADQIRDVLEGKTITHFSSRFKKSIAEDWAGKFQDQTIKEVRAHGKNLFFDADSGWTMYSHMMMWGSWHVYEHGQEWRKEERKSRVVIHTDQHVIVLFSAPVCEVIRTDQLNEHTTAKLGPDLMRDDVDAEEVWRRMHDPRNADLPLGEAIMIQEIMAGIGNILKSEVLFLAGLHPLRTAGSLQRDEFDRFMALAKEAMRRSVIAGGFNGVFVPWEQMPAGWAFGYTYRRRTKPCLVCGTPIEMVRQGFLKRMTWYCPQCQPLDGHANLIGERAGDIPAWLPPWQRLLPDDNEDYSNVKQPVRT